MPTIMGVATEALTLTGSEGTATGTPAPTLTLAWQRQLGTTGTIETLTGGLTSPPLALGYRYRLRATASNGVGSPVVAYSAWSDVAAAAAAPLASIGSNGYLAVWADGTPPTFDPDGNPITVTAQTPGFDATMAATTHAVPITITRRRRVLRSADNQALFGASADVGDPNRHPRMPSDVVLSWDVLAGAVIAGTVNNSTRTSPKPRARWLTEDRFLCGDVPFAFEFVAFHRGARSGEPCAAARVTVAAGGAPTVPLLTYDTSAVVVSQQSIAGCAMTCYRVTIDPSTLPDAAHYVINAEVYPWLGDAASVLKSADGTDRGGFAPRYFTKHLARAAAPYIIVIDPAHPSASATAGAVSTDPAVARATPWTNIPNAMRYGVHTPGLDHSHCEIWLGSGVTITADITNAAARNQTLAGLIIRTDPAAAARATLTLNGVPRLGIGTTAYGLPTGCLKFRDINLVRGTVTDCEMMLGAGVSLDANGGNAPLSGVARVSYRGCTITGTLGAAFFEGLADLVSGVICANANSAGFSGAVLGSRISGIGRPATNAGIVAYNDLTFGVANQGICYGGILVQNAISFLAGAGDKVIKISADSEAYNTNDTLIWHNSLAGSASMRANMFYDELTGTWRTHTRLSIVGNAATIRAASKGDLFILDGSVPHNGNEEWSYGVGVWGNLFGGTTNFLHDYDGIGSLFNGPEVGSPYSAAQTDPQFVKDGSAGGDNTGISNLRITSATSPARQRVRDTIVLKYDLDGNLRSGPHADAGAYRIAA